MQIYWLLTFSIFLLAGAGCSSGAGGPVKVGDLAPDFSVPDSSGKNVSLQDFRGQIVVLFFYPKDNTSICTKEACLFRDSYSVFKDNGATVLGISSDSIESHQGFAKKNNLNFPLLSDEGGKVRLLYGVPKTMGLLPGRVTYIINKDGIVKHLFNSQIKAKMHIEEALKTVRELTGK